MPPRRLPLDSLPADLGRQLRQLTTAASTAEVPLWVVGGLPRDLLLGRATRDLDLVVERDLRRVAPLLAAAVGGRVRTYTPFLTAIVEIASGEALDIAAFRRESYPRTAVLPEVAPGILADDLARRDFTINALACRLWPDTAGEIVDLHGGLADLDSRTLRILHPRSFHDDPTRAFRAARFAARLGFALALASRASLEAACRDGAFAALSGSRLRTELELIFAETNVLGSLRQLDDFGLLPHVDPALSGSPRLWQRLEQALAAWPARLPTPAGEAPPELRRVLLLALVEELPRDARLRLAGRLDLRGDEARLVVEGPERMARARERLRDPGLAPHLVEELLLATSEEERILLGREGGIVRTWVERFARELRPFALSVRGLDLIAAGIAAGPAIGRALAETRRARLDGEIPAEAELSYALDHARTST